MVSYFNGGSPNFLGQLFTSGAALLNTIKVNLTVEGWVATNDSIAANNFLIMRGTTTNNHNCWVKFSTSVVTAGVQERLTVQGDLDGNNTTLSASGVTLDYKPGANNYLYVTCDNDSGCLCIYPDVTLTVRSCHFGFCDRIDTTDQWAWYVGDLYGAIHNNKYVAKSRHNNTNWRQISDDYYANATIFSGTGGSLITNMGAYHGTWDRYTTCMSGSVQLNSTSYNQNNAATSNITYIANSNVAAFGYLGRSNGINNMPVLDNYFYIEGRGASNNYAGSTFQFYYRGDIKHAVVGVASYNGGVQLLTTDGERYLSGGSQGWQGFRIG